MTRPEWRPDFGPAHPHPTAGATVVGAREILVAYNVNLATGRLEVARRIASLIRERDGGLPGVRALGLSLPHRGIVQVSMNLVDYRTTALRVVFDRIAAEAARDGVDVLESEIVGLVPSAALADTTPEHLRLSGFSDRSGPRGAAARGRLSDLGRRAPVRQTGSSSASALRAGAMPNARILR